MAKTKSDKKSTKMAIDDDTLAQETSAEVDFDADEVEAAADDADATDADVDADADANADIPTDDADDGGGDDESEAAPEPTKQPKPKLTWLTIILILLNWIAAPTFVFLALVDHNTRAQYSYRALFNYAQIWGLPLGAPLIKDADGNEFGEDDQPSLSNETRPVMRLTPQQVGDVFNKRPGALKVPVKDFAPVEEPVPVRLRPRDMSDDLLEALYGPGVKESERYKTLEDAVKGLKESVPNDIANAAKEVKDAFKKKKDDEKRAFVQKTMFIMTYDPGEQKKAEDLIANAAGQELDDLVNRALVQKCLEPIALDFSDEKDGRRIWVIDRIRDEAANLKGAPLEALVEEAAQRRIYYEILTPINAFRPGDLTKTEIERFADRDKIKMDRLKEVLEKRFDAAISGQYDPKEFMGEKYWVKGQDRDSIEKRRHIGFILFTLAHVNIPVLDKKLYPKGIERAQTVSGIYEFNNASIAFVQTLLLRDRQRDARVKDDRDGIAFLTKDKTPSRTTSFIDQQPAQIDNMQRLVELVETAQKRLDEKKTERDKLKKIYDERLAQLKAVTERLLKARQLSNDLAKELREKQVELHEALLKLSDAADTNFRLEAEIRRLELSYFTAPKGGKKQP